MFRGSLIHMLMYTKLMKVSDDLFFLFSYLIPHQRSITYEKTFDETFLPENLSRLPLRRIKPYSEKLFINSLCGIRARI